MKLLVLSSTYPRGANDTLPGFVHELSSRLARDGHEVHVLTPRLPGGLAQETLDGVHVRRFGYWLRRGETLAGPGGIVGRIRQRPWRVGLVLPFLLCFAFQIAVALRRQRFDLVHAHWLIPQGVLAAAVVPWCSEVPLICTAHGSDIHALRGTVFHRLRAFVARRARFIAVVSAALRDQLIADGIPASRIEVASMGVDLSARFRAPTAETRVHDHLLFVGRLVPVKGVSTLLEAYASLRATRPDCRLTIVGDGPERKRLEALARDLGIAHGVHFAGARPQAELPAFYARAGIAVVPSLAEGFGLVTLEAMGCGCAVVASDLPPLRALITEGSTGLLVPAGKAAPLAAALSELLSDPARRERLARQGRESVLTTYDWPAVVERYTRLYERACAVDNSARSGTPTGGHTSGD